MTAWKLAKELKALRSLWQEGLSAVFGKARKENGLEDDIVFGGGKKDSDDENEGDAEEDKKGALHRMFKKGGSATTGSKKGKGSDDVFKKGPKLKKGRVGDSSLSEALKK